MAKGYLSVNQNVALGSVIINMSESLSQLMYSAEILSDKIAQSTGDDPSGTQLANLMGVASPDIALAVKDLLGSLKNDLNNPNNVFLQFRSRINRT